MAHDGQDMPMTQVILPDLLGLTSAAVPAAETVLARATDLSARPPDGRWPHLCNSA